jgi:hypothetical protein
MPPVIGHGSLAPRLSAPDLRRICAEALASGGLGTNPQVREDGHCLPKFSILHP